MLPVFLCPPESLNLVKSAVTVCRYPRNILHWEDFSFGLFRATGLGGEEVKMARTSALQTPVFTLESLVALGQWAEAQPAPARKIVANAGNQNKKGGLHTVKPRR